MADVRALEAQRKQLMQEIQRRGGRGKAQGFEQQLANVEAQLRSARGPGQVGTNPAGSQLVDPNAQYNTAGQVINTSFKVNNPDQSGPFGGANWEVGPDGRPIRNEFLSPEQEKILRADEALSQMGRKYASDNLASSGLNEAFDPYGEGGVGAARDRIEDAVFKRITKDFDQNKQREIEQAEQTLYERGIPLDPNNPLYQRTIGDINKRYDDQAMQGRLAATQLGGEELTRDFSISAGTRQQQLGEVQGLGDMGSGVMTPNLFGYSPPNTEGTILGFKELQEARRARKAEEAIARMRAGAGGGGGGQPQLPPSPFNAGPPPGFGG